MQLLDVFWEGFGNVLGREFWEDEVGDGGIEEN